ncbi:hypothetical protein P7K49_001853, partial [Saguinus oedipus]
MAPPQPPHQAAPGRGGRPPSIPKHRTLAGGGRDSPSSAEGPWEALSPLSCHPRGGCQPRHPALQQEGNSGRRSGRRTPPLPEEAAEQPHQLRGLGRDAALSVLICEMGRGGGAWEPLPVSTPSARGPATVPGRGSGRRARGARGRAGARAHSQHHGRQVVRGGGGGGGGGGERGRVRVRGWQRGRVRLQRGAGRPVARALLVCAQAGQLRGRSPVCRRTWLRSVDDWLKRRLQKRHTKGLSSVWMRMCERRLLRELKPRWQMTQRMRPAGPAAESAG